MSRRMTLALAPIDEVRVNTPLVNVAEGYL